MTAGAVHLACLLAGLLSSVAPTAVALPSDRSDDYQWRLCPPARLVPLRPFYTDEETDRDAIEIRAETSRIVQEGISQFTGDVEIVKGDQSMRAEVVTYDDTSGIFSAEGRAHLWNAGMIWAGESATYDTTSEVSELDAGRYWLLDGRGRGFATRLHNDKQAQVTTLNNVQYSTCPLSDEAWRISAGRIKLNHETDRGSAINAVLRVRDVPVFYFPYVSFPLSDKRKSGFLAPSLGTTNQSGFDARIPYYWNIAPDQDATITPRILTDRGVMLETEYRYLSSTYRGRANVEYLPSDDLRGDDRSLFSVSHQQRFFGQRGHLRVNLNNVSDDEYFEDFGSNIAVTSQRFLDRRIEYRHYAPRSFFYGLVQAYQTIDPTIPDRAEPYRQLPRTLYLTTIPLSPTWLTQLRGDAVYFHRDVGLTGGRLHVAPTLQHRFFRPYLDIISRFTARHTQYFLDDPDANFDDRESSTVPVVSIDARLFAERDLEIFGRHHLQTFEPRLFYLLAPKVDQDDLPRFDTGLLETSFRSIFLENRFSGGDRIGDANQVTAAITSRILDTEDARELGHLSFGQIFYFRDREVTLPGATEIEDSVSELVFEGAANLGLDWSVRGILLWDPNQPRTEKATLGLRYSPDYETVVNLNYRLRRARTDVEQTDFSFRVPVLDNLALVGRWNFSLPEKRSLETVAGLEYESCCWGLRLVARRFLRNAEGQFETGVFLQVQFRGLGGIGQDAAGLLRRGIPGYVDPFN
ncbi:MAG: LPS assembly protein LptD [Gammaproteobacteria bacterium]